VSDLGQNPRTPGDNTGRRTVDRLETQNTVFISCHERCNCHSQMYYRTRFPEYHISRAGEMTAPHGEGRALVES